jgi:hypothetical protein
MIPIFCTPPTALWEIDVMYLSAFLFPGTSYGSDQTHVKVVGECGEIILLEATGDWNIKVWSKFNNVC